MHIWPGDLGSCQCRCRRWAIELINRIELCVFCIADLAEGMKGVKRIALFAARSAAEKSEIHNARGVVWPESIESITRMKYAEANMLARG